jgi:gluconolactonase
MDRDEEGLMGKLSAGHKFVTGITWARAGFLIFSDTPAGQIVKIGPQGKSILREGLSGPEGLAIDDKGRIYICESRARRLVRIDRQGGDLQTVAERWEGKRLNAPNDVVIAKSGSVYFTDPAFGSADSQRELDFYGIYHLTPKGELRLAAKTEGRPNGLALSPDSRILYVADSDSRQVLAFDIGKDGGLENQRIFVKVPSGVPDGLRTDADGNIYVAAAELLVFSPDGKQVRSIPVPDKPSSVTFGETKMSTLFIGAADSVYRMRLEREAQH